MKSAGWVVMMLGAGALVGCGGSESESATTGEVGEELVLATPDFEVPPGDSFECFYTDVKSDKEMAVIGATGHQTEGGHHVNLYYVDEEQPVGHHPCTDDEMTNWHQVTGAALDGEPVLDVPEGLATRIPAGKQLVLQSHYVNTTGATLPARDEIHAKLTDPATIAAYVNIWVIQDAAFSVPPHAAATHKSICEVQKDADLVLLFGHEHELGKHFTLEQVDEQGNVLETLYDHEWEASYVSHAPQLRYTRQAPLHIAKGTRFRQTCTWDNPTAEEATFPREMCVTFGYYFPDDGDRICLSTPEP